MVAVAAVAVAAVVLLVVLVVAVAAAVVIIVAVVVVVDGSDCVGVGDSGGVMFYFEVVETGTVTKQHNRSRTDDPSRCSESRIFLPRLGHEYAGWSDIAYDLSLIHI